MKDGSSLGFAVGLAVALSGCLSTLNAPDRNRLDASRDGGLDAGPEEGGTDAGQDGGAMDGGCRGLRFETMCSDRQDNDCDGLVDCRDFDCARDLACCDATANQWEEDFGPGAFSLNWISLPRTNPFPIMPTSGGKLRNFGDDGPRAVLRSKCVPIDLGVEIVAHIQVIGDGCSADGPCENYAGLVLTPARDMAPGVSLPEELAVRAYGDGRYEVRRAGRALREKMIGRGPATVRIQLAPGLDELGRAWVYADIQLGADDVESPPVPFIPRDDLLDFRLGCEEARGLYLAIEGQGSAVAFDRLDVSQFQCSNPSHFERRGDDRTVIDNASLGMGMAGTGWTSGGIGNPALRSWVASQGPPPTFRWELYFDGSDVERSAEPFAPVRFAIGRATTGDVNGIDMWTLSSGGRPVLGTSPPSRPSYREPAVLVWVDPADGTRARENGLLAFARETGDPSVFAIAGRLIAADGSMGMEAVILTAHDAGCRSVGDPALLPAFPKPELVSGRLRDSGVFLFFTCEPMSGPPEIRAAWIADTTSWPGDISPVQLGPVLRPADVGPIAERGLRAADGEVWFRGEPMADGGMAYTDVTYRLWAVVRNRAGKTSLVFAEGTGPISGGTLPPFRPYAGNPVLTADDPLLGDCPLGDCPIESVAVTRHPNDPTRLRVLISRMVVGDSAIRHVLVPLDQIWPR